MSDRKHVFLAIGSVALLTGGCILAMSEDDYKPTVNSVFLMFMWVLLVAFGVVIVLSDSSQPIIESKHVEAKVDVDEDNDKPPIATSDELASNRRKSVRNKKV